jgi:hypothetical protein
MGNVPQALAPHRSMAASSSSIPNQITLREGLTIRTVDELKKLLDLLPIAEKPTRKAELVSAIADYLLGPGLKKLWSELDQCQQSAVAEAVYCTEGVHRPEQFQAKYGQLPEWGSQRGWGYSYNKPAAKLDLFFYPVRQYRSPTELPVDLANRLKAFVPEPEPLRLISSEHLPDTVQITHKYPNYRTRKVEKTVTPLPLTQLATEALAQQDLLAVLRLVHLGKVSVSEKTLMPSKATLAAIAPLLQGGDYYTAADEPDEPGHEPIGFIKPLAWTLLVQAAGLAKLDGKKLQLTAAGQKAMGGNPAKTLKAMWKKWLKTTFLDELRRVDAIKGQTGKGKRSLTAVSGRRATLVQLLNQCPVGEWVTYDQFKRYGIASDQTFEVSRNPEALYISEPGYGYLYEAGGAWSILQDAYARCFLMEYAATLGLLDVAYIPPYDTPRGELDDFWGTDDLSFLSRYDGLIAFRLNALGAFCLGKSEQYTPIAVTPDSSLRVLPNLDIVMTGAPLSPASLLMMETFTQQTADAVWKLDREMALKAAEAGHSLQEFQTFLQQASAEALPSTVEQFLEDCRQRSESLQDLGMARLVVCHDATLAAQIAHDSRTKKYCQLAGDRHLVVPLDQETRFRSGLRKLGYSLPLS